VTAVAAAVVVVEAVEVGEAGERESGEVAYDARKTLITSTDMQMDILLFTMTVGYPPSLAVGLIITLLTYIDVTSSGELGLIDDLTSGAGNGETRHPRMKETLDEGDTGLYIMHDFGLRVRRSLRSHVIGSNMVRNGDSCCTMQHITVAGAGREKRLPLSECAHISDSQ
jgi:hypothetical protein